MGVREVPELQRFSDEHQETPDVSTEFAEWN
jgi:hypothetical protein